MIEINHLRMNHYNFQSVDAEQRFERATNQTTGPIVLKELRDLLVAAGVHKSVFLELEPRSVYRPEMLDEPLNRFFQPKGFSNYDKDLYQQAVDQVSRRFKIGHRVNPISVEQVVLRMDLSKSAGAPTFLKKVDCLEESIMAAHHCEKGKCPPPMTVYHRGKDLQVARPVECFPFEWHLIEGRFFYPFHDALMSHKNPYFVHRTRTEIAQEVNAMSWDTETFVCLDYSGFDGTISTKLISDSFRIIRDNLSLTMKEHVLLDRVATYFATGPILLPDKRVASGRRGGVPSGSMFTQLVDSLVNSIVIEYGLLRLRTKTNGYLVVGDDSVIGIKGILPSIVKWSNVISELGIVVNVKKSSVVKGSAPLHFLGHNVAALARRDERETFRKIVTPERWDSRFSSKDERVRFEKYAEIVRGHMLDNASAFGTLERVLEVLEGYRTKIYVGDRIRIYEAAYQTTKNKPEYLVEKSRWNRAVQSQLAVPTRNWINGVLMII